MKNLLSCEKLVAKLCKKATHVKSGGQYQRTFKIYGGHIQGRTVILTILPALEFSGMLEPVSSLEGLGALIGKVYPTTHYLTISRGTFSKGLGFADLQASFVPLIIGVPVLLGLGAALLKKQES